MFIIRRAVANILTFFGVTVSLVVIVLLIISLIYVRNAIPAASVFVWFLIIVIVIVILVLVLIGVVVYGVSFMSEYFKRTKTNIIAVRRLEVEQETFAVTQEAQRKAIETSLEQPIVQGLLGQPNQAQPGGKPNIIFYKAIKQYIKPGQTLVGVKQDGTLRVGEWSDYKTMLVLGGSSSGKTTTIIEKVLSAVRSGAYIVICDPHANKDDSLFKRIYPLQPFLFPGTTFAVEHKDIIKNVRIVKKELERRVADKSGTKHRMLVLVVEEWNRLQRDKFLADELMEIAQELGQEGRGFYIYGVFGAQQITGSVELRKSVISSIVHRVDETEASLVIPSRYGKFAPELPTGHTFVKDSDGRTEGLQQTVVTLQDIQEVAYEMMANLRINNQPQAQAPMYQQPAQPAYQQPVQPYQQPAPQANVPIMWSYGPNGPIASGVPEQALVRMLPLSELDRINGYTQPVQPTQPGTPMQRPQWVDDMVQQNEIANSPTRELTGGTDETINGQPTDEVPVVTVTGEVVEVKPKLDIHQRLARFVIKRQKF